MRQLMGAWGPTTFEDDTALDWLGDFEDAPDRGVIETCLEQTAGSKTLEARQASKVLAAVELVPAALGRPPDGPLAERLRAAAQIVGDLDDLRALVTMNVFVDEHRDEFGIEPIRHALAFAPST